MLLRDVRERTVRELLDAPMTHHILQLNGEELRIGDPTLSISMLRDAGYVSFRERPLRTRPEVFGANTLTWCSYVRSALPAAHGIGV